MLRILPFTPYITCCDYDLLQHLNYKPQLHLPRLVSNYIVKFTTMISVITKLSTSPTAGYQLSPNIICGAWEESNTVTQVKPRSRHIPNKYAVFWYCAL